MSTVVWGAMSGGFNALSLRRSRRSRGGADLASGRQVREVGDGNINYVWAVEGPSGSLCLKQGPPYVRVMASWALSQASARTVLYSFLQGLKQQGRGKGGVKLLCCLH